MRALGVFPGARAVRLVERDLPCLGSPTDVRLHVLDVGVCGTDRARGGGRGAVAHRQHLAAEQAAAWGLVNRVVAPAELLPACRVLAADIRSAPQDVVRAYKRVIDEGFASTLAEGLRVEAQANRDHARTLTPEAIAARRAAVQSRGRDQAAG